METVCHTLEGALEKAIEQEQQSIRIYLDALKRLDDPRAREVLKDLVREELEHKYMLEKALIGEAITLHEEGESTGASMNLAYFLRDKALAPDSSPQDVMIYAIHDEKRSAEFYTQMVTQCRGAPMEEVFKKIHQQEMFHLARLEESYETLYMSQM
jgi:rubrerythrin